MAEAMNAFLRDPQLRKELKSKAIELTDSLISELGLFMLVQPNDTVNLARLKKSITEKIISPAMALHEKLMCTKNAFSFEFKEYPTLHIDETHPDFYKDLADLKCDNAAHNCERFILEEIEPQPSAEQVRGRLLNLFAVSPSLVMEKLGKERYKFEPAATLVKQKMLVAWKTSDTLDNCLAPTPTFFKDLLSVNTRQS